MNILLIGDEKPQAPYHPLSAILPDICKTLEKIGTVTTTNDYTQMGEMELAQFDLVISYSDLYERMKGFDDVLAGYVEHGGRLLALHTGICVVEEGKLAKAIGGSFITHPPYCQLTYYDMSGKAVMTCGEEAYMVRQYDDGNRIFLEFDYEGKRYPAGWLRQSGRGHAAYLAPGHDARTTGREEFQELLRRTVTALMSQ